MPPRRSRAVRAAQTSGTGESARKRAKTQPSTSQAATPKPAATVDALAGADDDIAPDLGLSSADTYFAAQFGAVAKGSGTVLSSVLPPLRAHALQQLFPPLPPSQINASAHCIRRALSQADRLKETASAPREAASKRGTGTARTKGKGKSVGRGEQPGLEQWPIPGSTEAGGPLSTSTLSELAVLASQTQYEEWDQLFCQGHAILLHGPGDAEAVLAAYVRQKPPASLGSTVLFRAYTPGTTAALLKSLLDQLEQVIARSGVDDSALVYQGADWHGSNVLVRSRRIAYAYRLPPDQSELPPLYLAVSQVDSKLFRVPLALDMLKVLASAPSIFVIASASHVNAPLLFPPSATLVETDLHAPPQPIPWVYASMATFVPPISRALYAAAAPRGGPLKLPAPLSLRGVSSATALAPGLAGSDVTDLPTISLARTERILAALPERAVNLFALISSLQLSGGKTAQAAEALAGQADAMCPAPVSQVVEAASADFIARDLAGLKAMLPEFTSHGLIHSLPRSSERAEEELWVALKQRDLVTYLERRMASA